MYPIQESEWQQVSINTWQDLSPHMWECFRLSLMEATTEQEVKNVVIKFSKIFYEIEAQQSVQGVNVEHSHIVSSTEAQMVVNIVVSKRDYKSAMMDYLPWYERESIIFDEILNAYDKQFRIAEQNLEIVDRNMFLDTAIESLGIYERDLGIKTIKTLQYDQRREQVSARNRAIFEQTTEDTIKNVASAYGNGQVEVNNTITPGIYEIKFVGTGIPNNLEGLKETLDIIVPAHLGLEYVLVGNIFEIIGKLTWGEAKMKTWNEVIRWEGAS